MEQSPAVGDNDGYHLYERGLMKLKYLAAFLMLLALGCTSQSSSTSTTPETVEPDSATTATVTPETDTPTTQTVSFKVTGMS